MGLTKKNVEDLASMNDLYSKVFQERWQVEEVLTEKTISGGNGSITKLEVIVHDVNNPAIKYTARVGGSSDNSVGKWGFSLGIPADEKQH